jgi:hypothetical protein
MTTFPPVCSDIFISLRLGTCRGCRRLYGAEFLRRFPISRFMAQNTLVMWRADLNVAKTNRTIDISVWHLL